MLPQVAKTVAKESQLCRGTCRSVAAV